ncbi:MAG TPA: hypothetical protein VFH58_06175 [Acidimicrobiales bacterium]|nr:hypothetical protein [Acidimicrobiales bacterium]
MSWLLREGEVLAAVDPPGRGWPDSIKGAVVRRSPVVVHTFASSHPVEVAWCDRGTTDRGEPCLTVRRITCLPRRRLGRPKLSGGAVVAAEAGAFDRWNLQIGDQLEIREV